MHQDDTNLARQHFAAVIAKLEDANIIAARGNRQHHKHACCVRARDLRMVAQDVAAIAEAALALIHQIDTNLQTSRRKPR